MAFKAYTRPHYLSLAFTEDIRIDQPVIREEDIRDLEKLDPLRRAFDLAERAESFKSDFKGISELKNNYADIQNELELFTRGILTQCSDMVEVKTILKHKPRGDDGQDMDDNFMKALWEGRKDFVSHPFYQQYLWKQMTGSSKKGSEYRFSEPLWNIVYIPYAYLLFCCYPIVVFADFFRNADILFVPVEGNDLKEKESLVFGFFQGAIHTPIYRMIVYSTIQFCYLSLLVVSVWNPNETADNTLNHWYVYLAVVMTVIFLIEDGLDYYLKSRQKDKARAFESFWNPFSLVSRLILLIGGIISASYLLGSRAEGVNRADLSGNHELNVGMTFVSVAIGLEFFIHLRILLLLEYLGPIVICVIGVFKDALRVTSIYLIIFGAHALCAWSMFKPYQENYQQQTENSAKYTLVQKDLVSKKGLLINMIWRILSADGPGKVHIKLNGAEDEDFSQEFAHVMGTVLWGIYQIVVAILMLNITIAIMNNTYSELWKRADKEWKYSKSYYQVKISNSISQSHLFVPQESQI